MNGKNRDNNYSIQHGGNFDCQQREELMLAPYLGYVARPVKNNLNDVSIIYFLPCCIVIFVTILFWNSWNMQWAMLLEQFEYTHARCIQCQNYCSSCWKNLWFEKCWNIARPLSSICGKFWLQFQKDGQLILWIHELTRLQSRQDLHFFVLIQFLMYLCQLYI